MNIKVRSFLIERAREIRNETIHYQELCDKCKLGLDMSRIDHRAEIGRILGEISSYEHHNDRPLLSALVVRAGDNYEGDGFFKLAEELELGNWKKLRDSNFDILEINKCIAFWTDDSNYSKYKDAQLFYPMEIRKMQEHFEVLKRFDEDYRNAHFKMRATKASIRREGENELNTTHMVVKSYFEHNPDLYELLQPEELKHAPDQRFLEQGFTERDFDRAFALLKRMVEAK